MKINIDAIYLITRSLEKFLQKNSIKEPDLVSIQQKLDSLFGYIPLPKYECIPARLERLTINESVPPFNNERINEIKYIKYPPVEFVKKYGRCNVLNHSMFYGAFNFLTIMGELKPGIGKAVTHSEWVLKEDAPLKMFPIFFITKADSKGHNSLSLEILDEHEDFTSHFSNSDRKALDMSVEFLAKCFAKDVEHTNHFDYFLSSYISKKIFDFEEINYDGIVYPSVQLQLEVSNMAIRPDVFDKKFKLRKVGHAINIIEPGKNGINYVTSRSTLFDLEKGLIIWD